MKYNTDKKHTCPKCKKAKLQTREFFHWVKRDEGTLQTACIECTRAAARQWRENNKEKINRKARDYYSDPANALIRHSQNMRSYYKNREHHEKQNRIRNRKFVDQYRNRPYAEKEEIRQIHTFDLTGKKNKRGEHLKKCCKCHQIYGLSDFHKTCTTPDGHDYICRYCSPEEREKYKR